ncbi:NT-amidase, putative [Candida dubliniensis CD36]|uniref:Protein N-terminal amidase, putative n=1 Tax=Candida dubliniensis (strain CD36 / ATCC MYA-646 / CBS 7987 / NCPF 3949 / NRRL Y-17841) TaxID=573826 RepID=B9WB47_CANDC|nr:NT-amidase, putative [Candida dubliniensis CD36]CAX43617.1 NT-amidase, putative [Candida dubliniensis CD36]
MKLKVALLQLNPRIGKINENISNVYKLLSSSTQQQTTITTTKQQLNNKFDLIVLPELAITGYNFPNSTAIKPYLESIDKFGPSLNLGRELSIKYQSMLVIGYPEFSHGDNKIYNSCAVFNRCGQLIYNYRKTFLYETDEIWGCNENPIKGFPSIELDFSLNNNNNNNNNKKKIDKNVNENSKSTSLLITTNIGICMDLNPYKFEAPFNKFEFSMSSYSQRAKLLICPMAWLNPSSPSILDKEEFDKSDKLELAQELELELKNSDFVEPNWSTINYWILRFFPYLSHKYSIMPKWFNKIKDNNDEKITVICCNRVGVEEDVVYAGSSCILQFNNHDKYNDATDLTNKSVELIGNLDQINEGILIKEIDI